MQGNQIMSSSLRMAPFWENSEKLNPAGSNGVIGIENEADESGYKKATPTPLVSASSRLWETITIEKYKDIPFLNLEVWAMKNSWPSK